MQRMFVFNGRFCGATAGWLRPVAAVCLLLVSCAPMVANRGEVTRNPVEVLEKSPRVYHIRFEGFADSLETRRAAAYMSDTFGTELEVVSVDTAGADSISDSDRAMIEYNKAVRRYEAGAGRASLTHTRRALELDPGHGPSYVLLGNLLLAQGRTGEALSLFRRIVAWDPTDSEALVGLARCYMYSGSLDSARMVLIDAVIYDRVNLNAWRNLHMLGAVQRFSVADHDIFELGYVREENARNYDIVVDSSLEECPSQATAWIVFASERAVWRYEGKFKRTLGVTRYRRTYQEDIDCFMALAAAWNILSREDSTRCGEDYLDFMSKVAEDGYLVPHVLFDYVCLEEPRAARNFREDVINEMRTYVDNYILVAGG